MKSVIVKMLAALALTALAPFAQANPLGALMCPTCEIPPNESITQLQRQRATDYANAIFPAGFQPSPNDVLDVCNGTRCVQQQYVGGKWVDVRGASGIGVTTDNYKAAGKNYINISAAGKQSGVSFQPYDYNGVNYNVTTTGHWEGIEWRYNGVVYQVSWAYVLDGVNFTFIEDRPNPYVTVPM